MADDIPLPITRLAGRIKQALLEANPSPDDSYDDQAMELAALLHAERVVALLDGHLALEYTERQGIPVLIPPNHYYVVVPAYHDPEVQAMAAVHAALDGLDREQQARIVAWAHERFGLDVMDLAERPAF